MLPSVSERDVTGYPRSAQLSKTCQAEGRQAAESGLNIRPDVSTASKSAPVNEPRACRASLLQCPSGTPEMYHGEPLSARITPYRFIASATTRAWAGSRDVSTLDLSRNRCPICGRAVLDELDAAWRAGQT